MIPEFISLPFSISDVYEGFAEAKGLLQVNDNFLILEFEIQDGFIGLIKSKIKHVMLAIGEIDSVTLSQGWLRTVLTIRVRSLNSLPDLPKRDRGQIKLYVSRRDRRVAEHLVTFLRLRISEQQLYWLDEKNDSPD